MRYHVRIRFSAPWVHLHTQQTPPWVVLTPLYRWMVETARLGQTANGGWERWTL